MSSIPAVCNRCGYTFVSPFSLGNSRNSAVIGCGTTCPKCGGNASVIDSYTDSEGRLHIQDVFNYVQTFKDTAKLKVLKTDLEAANDKITAEELADTLAEIEPGFDKFKSIIQSLPSASISSFISILVSILTLVILYQTWQSSEDNHNESIGIQKSQLELSREQFEYQKEQDKKDNNSKSIADKERENIQKQIDDLKKEFDKKLKNIEQKNNSNTTKTRLKGNCRNKPCPCGSGKKAKKCHPNGYYA